MNDRAVLLMAYGSPSTLDDVAPYLAHIRGGQEPSSELIEEVRDRYRAIGGASPLPQITREQAEALAVRTGLPVYVGMKHAPPFIAEAVARMRDDGVRRVVALALAPHYSRISIGGYIAAAQEAAAQTPGIAVAFIESWHLDHGLIDALVARVRRALARLEKPDAAPVVFTAHSLPKRIQEWGDPYVTQLIDTARAVASAAELTRWSFAFQSASATGEPWLGPDILDVVRELHGQGVREMVVCPAGFVADHLEVLYDLDVEATGLARSLGLRLLRTESLNAAPDFIATLADIVQQSPSP